MSGTGKATNFKFGRYIHRVHLNKSPLKILEKRERGPQATNVGRMDAAGYDHRGRNQRQPSLHPSDVRRLWHSDTLKSENYNNYAEQLKIGK